MAAALGLGAGKQLVLPSRISMPPALASPSAPAASPGAQEVSPAPTADGASAPGAPVLVPPLQATAPPVVSRQGPPPLVVGDAAVGTIAAARTPAGAPVSDATTGGPTSSTSPPAHTGVPSPTGGVPRPPTSAHSQSPEGLTTPHAPPAGRGPTAIPTSGRSPRPGSPAPPQATHRGQSPPSPTTVPVTSPSPPGTIATGTWSSRYWSNWQRGGMGAGFMQVAHGDHGVGDWLRRMRVLTVLVTCNGLRAW